MAEGTPLLREYGVKPIEGSNPSLSAIQSGLCSETPCLTPDSQIVRGIA